MSGSARYLGPSPEWPAAALQSHSAAKRQRWVETSPGGRTSDSLLDPLGMQGEGRGKNTYGFLGALNGSDGGPGSWKEQVWNTESKKVWESGARVDLWE